MGEPSVLFVSKPIVPPWNDGSKNLVRDVASNLRRARPTVMTTADAPRDALGPRVDVEGVYRDAGRFAPSVTANARVALRLLTGSAHDVWHFVFAPNPVSSSVAYAARRIRRAAGWNGKVVQTIASAPRTFDGVSRWLFGDVVVVLSEHTRGGLLGAGVSPDRIRVIPPCAKPPADLRAEASRIRARHRLGDGPIVLYPGDYEVSQGAHTVAAATSAIVAKVPGVTVVFACRKKTAAADEAQRAVERELDRRHVSAHARHLGEVTDMAELLAVSSVVAFPVDDLYGKVDLPLVLLEAMALGLPIVVAGGGPLEALDFAPKVEPGDPRGLAEHVVRLLVRENEARTLGDVGKNVYDARYTPEAVATVYDQLYETLLDEDRPYRR